MTNFYPKKQTLKDNLTPRKETVHFILSFSRAYQVNRIDGVQYELLLN
ncbi:MAG: hypothetical protein RQ735_06535 [Flavobacteriaceae bacterium]|nr:hypothetical protein [Flavobacteriaceae bacterium]